MNLWLFLGLVSIWEPQISHTKGFEMDAKVGKAQMFIRKPFTWGPQGSQMDIK